MKDFSRDALKAALRHCRVHFFSSFWFQGVVSLSALTFPIYMIQIYERVLPSRNLISLLAIFLGASIVLCFAGLFAFIEKKLLLNASIRLDRFLAADTLRSLILRSSAEQAETGSQILRDLGVVRAYYTRTRPTAQINAPWALLFLLALYAINFWVGVYALCCLVIEALITVWNVQSTRRMRLLVAETGIKSQRMIDANIRSADAIVAMGLMPGFLRKWQGVDDAAVKSEAWAGTVSSGFQALSSSLTTIMQLGLLGVAMIAVIEGLMSPGYAFACNMAFSYMMRPLRDVIKAWEDHSEARAAYDRVNYLLNSYPSRDEEGMTLPKPKGEVAARRIVFFTPGSPKPILNGVNFGIEAGKAVGIIGPIGSGKTTLVRMLVGLIAPSHGELRLDGTKINEWDRNQVGRHIGYLPQEISLVAGTVAENIGRFGLFDEDQIYQAAVLAGVHNIILKLPDGYDTVIGDGGLRLSGGQRQLIGLARAVVGMPALVVLDEPNSNLDGPGEAALMSCIGELKKAGSTVIMVSHRPNLLQDFDRVILLRDGQVGFDGSVDEFMQMSGRPSIRVLKQGT